MRRSVGVRLARLPIRVRLTVWYVALLAAILVALSVFLLLRLRADLVAGVDSSLDARAAEITLGLQRPGDAAFQDVGSTLPGLSRRDSAAQLLSRTGSVLKTSGDEVARQPMLDPARRARLQPGQYLHTTVRLGPERERFRVLAVARQGPVDAALLAVGSSLDDVDASIDRLRLLLLVAIPGALALAGGGGWLLARKALLPVARMTSQAAAIGGAHLHDRVTIASPAADELARLAETLNGMLDRIERSVVEQRRLVADASHELRTPLAIMRAELEVGLRGVDLPPEAVEVLESSTEEVVRMSRIVDDLLTLARADEGQLGLALEPLDLGEVARAVTAKLRPLAEAKRIELSVDGSDQEVLADRSGITRVTANLVDNAVKFTAPGGAVRVAVWSGAAEGGLSVRDTGPGIAAEALPRVFDRFFRVDAGRSRAQGGSGLGLAICKEIVEAHGGRIWAESRPGAGSSFTLALPRPGERPGPGGDAATRPSAGAQPSVSGGQEPRNATGGG